MTPPGANPDGWSAPAAVGCVPNEGCPPEALLLWLVPGLVLGLAAGVVAGTVLPAPGWSHGRRWGPPLLVGVSVLAFVVPRVSPSFRTGRVDLVALEVAMWAVGGLLFGLALALGWPSARETAGHEGGP